MGACDRCHFILILFWEGLIVCKMALASQPCHRYSGKFISEPPDITAYEGEWANFTCSILNSSPNEYTLSWNVNPENEAAQEHLFQNDKSGVISTKLAIQASNRRDYFVTCNARDLRSDRQIGKCFSTRRATLTVRYFPRRSELRCSPNKSNELRNGDPINLKCSVTRSYPAVDLDWNLEDFNVTLPQIARDVGRARYLSYALRVTPDMHLKTITCKVTSRFAFPGKTLTCSIGPLNVFQSPRVSVHPTNPILQEDGHVNMSCEANGYPEEFDFIWTCLPDQLLFGCTTTDKNAVLSLNPNLGKNEQNYASVACTALNAAGNATESSTLIIERKSLVTKREYTMETSTEGLCETDPVLNITAYVHRKNKDHPTEINLLCLVSEAESSFRVQWFFDGIPINSTNKKFIAKKLWKSLYSLKIINPSQNDNGREVACTVITCNTTNTASHILSLVDDEKPLNLLSESTASPSTAPPKKEHQSNQLSLWHMITIVGVGVVLTIMITASLVTIIFICVYRRSGIVNNHGTNANTDNGLHQNVDQSIVSSEAHSSIDSTYEIPDVTIERNTATLAESHSFGTIPHYHGYGLEHTYAPGEARESSSSSQSSWTSISDTYDIESGYREEKITSQVNLETTFTSDAAYANYIKRITVH